MSSYRLALFVLLALSLSALVSAAPTSPAPPESPTHVLSYVPAKPEVTPADVRGGIRVTFDRDMILPAEVGKVVAGSAFEFNPVVLGEARWIDLRTLAFFPKDPLAPSTSYRVRLSSRLAKDLGRTIENWSGLQFVYDRIRVIHLMIEGDARYTSALPMVRLSLSQPSTLKGVLDACAFCSARANATEPCTRATLPSSTERPTKPATQFIFVPETPLGSESNYQVRCAAGLKPTAGDAGTLTASEHSLTTYGPAKVAAVEPADSQVPADKVRVSITFTTPVEPTLVREHVELINERGASKPIDFSGRWDRTTYAWSGNLDIGGA